MTLATVERNPAWHCARTRHAQEVRASVEVAGIGFRVFFPVRQVRVCHARKCEMVSKPLFSRYLIMQFDRDVDDWGRINGLKRSIVRILSDEFGRPQIIRASIIEAIKKRETEQKLNAGEIKSGYNPGDVFELRIGPYAGLPATYFGEEKGWATIGLTLFCRELTKEIPLAQLPPLGSLEAMAC